MQCRVVWNQRHLSSHTSQGVMKRFQDHQAQLLMQHERTRLPHAQEVVAARDRLTVMRDGVGEAALRVKQAQAELARCREVHALRRQELEETRYEGDIERLLATNRGETGWLMACPGAECRGFVQRPEKEGDLARCSLCQIAVCAECGVVVDEANGENGGGEDEHMCNEEDLSSFQALRRECRPCPSCNAPTHRISGCDQMFCTVCKTPWKWSTGEIIRHGVFHNPHFAQWQRENTTAAAPNLGGGCTGGLAVPWLTLVQLRESIDGVVDGRRRLSPLAGSAVLSFAKMLQQLRHRLSGPTPDQLRERSLAKLRIKYLQNEVSDDAWLAGVRRAMVRGERQVEVNDLLDAMLHSCHDCLEVIVFEGDPATRDEAVMALLRLAEWFNEAAGHIRYPPGTSRFRIQCVERKLRPPASNAIGSLLNLFGRGGGGGTAATGGDGAVTRSTVELISHQDHFQSIIQQEWAASAPSSYSSAYDPLGRQFRMNTSYGYTKMMEARSTHLHPGFGVLYMKLNEE